MSTTTGDSVFDDTLNQALAVQLQQSPYLDVSDHLMGRSPDQPIVGEIARDLCERQDSKAMLTGSIAKLAIGVLFQPERDRCNTGEVLAEEQAAKKEDVLKVLLGNEAITIRGKLGIACLGAELRNSSGRERPHRH